jgi:hypothetical protein
VLLGAFLVLLGIAISRPVVPEYHDISVTQTRDFCLAVDISGSMTAVDQLTPNQLALAQAAADAAKANGTAVAPRPTPSRRRSPASTSPRRPSTTFVKARNGDRVCLMYFDDDTYYSWPLTSDLNTILKRNKRTSGYSGGGTNFEGPTENDKQEWCRFKAGHQPLQRIRPGQEQRSIIIVSDGESSISEKRYNELFNQLKNGNIKLYVLGIAEGWVNGSDQTKDLRRLAEQSGGAVMVVGNAADMRKGVRPDRRPREIAGRDRKVGQLQGCLRHLLDARSSCRTALPRGRQRRPRGRLATQPTK